MVTNRREITQHRGASTSSRHPYLVTLTSSPLSRHLAGVVALLSTLAVLPALGQTYPVRPVRVLIPFAPGGGADALARIITPKLHESMGQPWIVDNRGGAAGNLAAETVVNAAPDGYTVFQGFGTVLTVNPSLYNLPFSM